MNQAKILRSGAALTPSASAVLLRIKGCTMPCKGCWSRQECSIKIKLAAVARSFTETLLVQRVAATVIYSLDVCIKLGDIIYTWIQFVLYSKQICLRFIYHVFNSSHETREGIDTWKNDDKNGYTRDG